MKESERVDDEYLVLQIEKARESAASTIMLEVGECLCAISKSVDEIVSHLYYQKMQLSKLC